MSKKSPWAWVPTLYFAEGLPYVAVMTISLIMYKRLGLSNTDITLYTSWLYLPWVIKPLWSPFIDIIKTKRWWIISMQLLIGAALGGVAFTIPGPYWLQGSLAFFWLMAFSSATHDIAADGFYMLGLKEHDQAYFVGIRSTFYRIATIVGQGLLVMLAGNLEVVTRNIKYSWSLMFYGMGGLFIAFWLWHHYILPRPSEDKGMEKMHGPQILQEFWHTLKTFFQKPQVWAGICFMLFYRMPEGLLAKVSALFLIDATAKASGIRFGTRHCRCHRTHAGRHSRRHCGQPRRTEALALAYGDGYHPARYCLCLPFLRPARESVHHQCLRLYRAVRLRLRLLRLHAIPYIL